MTLLLVPMSFAYASDSAMVVATVVLENISVSVSDGTINYGTLPLNSSANTITLTDTQTITNEGNITIDILIKGQDSANWTLGNSGDTNQYAHHFCNASESDCDTPTTNYLNLTTNNLTLDSGIVPNDEINLDLHITTPTTSTFFTEQNVDVIITAVAS